MKATQNKNTIYISTKYIKKKLKFKHKSIYTFMSFKLKRSYYILFEFKTSPKVNLFGLMLNKYHDPRIVIQNLDIYLLRL